VNEPGSLGQAILVGKLKNSYHNHKRYFMQIRILSVGDIKTPYLREGEADYFERLSHYCRFETVFIPGEKITRHTSDREILEKEEKKLLDRISEGDVVVTLDRRGRPWSSEELAKRIAGWQNLGIRRVVFVIGGPLGLGRRMLERADAVLSLSDMTFAHEMVKLILLEQLYRAFTIIKGEKYHK